MSSPLQQQPASSATPCLDRQIPFPPRNPTDRELRWWQLTLIAACLLVKTVFVIVAVWMLLVLITNWGILSGGLLVGFRFEYIRIGPFTIERSGKVTQHWTWHDLASGVTLARPASTKALRWRFCFYIAAGPAANLITAFVLSRSCHEIIPCPQRSGWPFSWVPHSWDSSTLFPLAPGLICWTG